MEASLFREGDVPPETVTPLRFAEIHWYDCDLRRNRTVSGRNATERQAGWTLLWRLQAVRGSA